MSHKQLPVHPGPLFLLLGPSGAVVPVARSIRAFKFVKDALVNKLKPETTELNLEPFPRRFWADSYEHCGHHARRGFKSAIQMDPVTGDLTATYH